MGTYRYKNKPKSNTVFVNLRSTIFEKYLKIRYLLIALFVLFITTHCTMNNNSSDKINSDSNITEKQTTKGEYNQTDSNGKKQGLWIEKIGKETRIERYYKDGIRSGIYRQFFMGNLSILGEYTNDKESGIWYYYDLGHLMMTFENYAQNYDTITNEGNKKKYVPDYKCYMKSYHSNGNIKDEGWLLWNEGESPESDFSVEYGTWKYYNEKGKLINTKEYKP